MSYRAALADAFVSRLRRLSPQDLSAIQAGQTPFDQFYQRALQQATLATSAFAADRAEAMESILRTRFQEIDTALSDPRVDRPGGTSQIRAMAKAATRALLVKGDPTFAVGAFDELYGPFRRSIVLSDLENEARRAVSAANSGR